ncbi:MAG: hypothetical protein FJZ63_01500, partial [Chlamydiae bacterium]|nr:hypothetical protein [Chlamydiota bacterium]
MFTQAFSQSLQTWASQLTAQLKKKQGAHYLSFPSTRKTDEKIQELVQTLSRLQTHKQASLQARISLEDLPALRLSLEGTQNPFLHAWHTVLSDEQLFLKTLNLIQDKAFLESYRVFLDDFQKKNPDFYRRHSAYMYELFLVAYLDNKISLEDISSAVEVRSALKALWHTVLFTNYPQRCKIFSSLAAGLKPKTPLLQHLLACALDPKLWKDYIPPSNSPKQYDIFLKILQAPLNDIVKNLDGIKRQWIPHRILLWTFFAYAQNLISEEKAHDVLSLIGGALKPLLQRLHPLPCQEETPLPTLSQKSLKKILDTIGDLRGHPLYNALQDLSLDPLAWQTFEATIQSEVFLNNYQKVLNDLQNNRLNFFATVLARHLPFIMLLAYLRGDLTPEIAALIFHVINTATSLELPITLGNTKAAVLFPWVVWQTAPQNFERAKKIFSPPPLFLNLLFHVSIKELSLSSDTPRDRFLKSLKFCSWFDLYGSEVFSFEKKCDLVAYVRDINLQTLSFNYRAFLQSLPRPGHNICSFRLYKDLDFNICSA